MTPTDLRWKQSVGRLLASMKLMRHFVKLNDTQAIDELERCFASDFSYVRKVRVLDAIVKRHAVIVFGNCR